MKSAQEQYEEKEGWIDYRGNIEEVKGLDSEALVFCKFREFQMDPLYLYKVNELDWQWKSRCLITDIVAYKIYKEGNQLEHNSNNTHTTEQSNNSIEQIIKEYFEIKETIETKQKELDALKDSLDTKYNELVEKGKNLNIHISIIDNTETTKTEELVITDWRYLKVGDMIWWSGDREHEAEVYKVSGMVDKGYAGSQRIYLRNGNWVDATGRQYLGHWSFVSRPS